MNFSLLQNFNKAFFEKKPFPYLVIENALPESACDELIKTFPIKSFEEMKKFNLSNERLDLIYNQPKKKSSIIVWDRSEIPNCWNEFMDQNTNNEFKLKLREIFKESFELIYQKQFPKAEDIFSNITVSANSPVKNNANSVRTAHLDQPSKLYTGLYYLRDDNDSTNGGDLDLLRWNENIIHQNDKAYFARKSEIQNNKVNTFKTVKYKKNTFIIFLNTIDSLHGVTKRDITKNLRKFCVLTGGLDHTLYSKGLSKKGTIFRFLKNIFTPKNLF